MTKTRIGIVGGGAAGLSLAKFLSADPGLLVTVFEASPEPGGKSHTLEKGGTRVEMGTCYTTTGHKTVIKWMRELGIGLRPVQQIKFDGAKFEDFVKAGAGSPTSVQIISYLLRRRAVLRGLAATPPAAWAVDEAAMPIAQWLDKYRLPKIYRLFLRGFTNMGYGFLDTSPTLHVLRWMDWDLIWSGLRKKLEMPRQGWSEFWRRLAADLDVHFNMPVSAIDRRDGEAVITMADQSRHVFDHIVCAIPVDDFNRLTKPTQNEADVAEAICWNSYTTTLFATDAWFTDHHIQSFSQALIPGAPLGKVLSARYDGHAPDLGGHIYLSGQFSGDYTPDEMKELLQKDMQDRGVTVTNIIYQKAWKYHAEYRPEAIRSGLLPRLEAMQGQNQTWYTGATFSHESINHIVNFNEKLAARMLQDLPQPHPVPA